MITLFFEAQQAVHGFSAAECLNIIAAILQIFESLSLFVKVLVIKVLTLLHPRTRKTIFALVKSAGAAVVKAAKLIVATLL